MEVELPLVAGSLLPRMVVEQEKTLGSSLLALNIDQPGEVKKGFKQARGKGVQA